MDNRKRVVCCICNKEVISIKQHIRVHHDNMTVQQYYDTYLKKEYDGICTICGSPTKFVHRGSDDFKYQTECSRKCRNIKMHQNRTAQQKKDICNKIKAAHHTSTTRNKTRATNIERYGTEYVTQNKTVQEKRKNTCAQKYGVDCSFKASIVKDKIKNTINTRYKNGFADVTITNKRRKTKLERYGSSTYNNTTKAKQTNLERYGVEHVLQDPKLIQKAKDTVQQNRDSFCMHNDCTRLQDLIKTYGTGFVQFGLVDLITYKRDKYVRNNDICIIEDYVARLKQNKSSNKEVELYNYITSIYSGTIIQNDRTILSGKELDIYIPDLKLAIEFNGNYWHSSACLPKYSHFDKSIQCEQLGIRLVHIYEYEWMNIVSQNKIKLYLNILLKNSNAISKIYARDCEVRLISNKEAKLFNETTHLQGHRNAKVTYGLFYDGKLVQLMSFSNTKYNRNLKNDNEWEIIRGCPGSNNIVVGGVSKLFKHFVYDYKPTKVFSYCDFNKFDGRSYEAIGMKFIGHTGPDKTWLVKGVPVKRDPKNYASLKSNLIIWGAGSKKYEITL